MSLYLQRIVPGFLKAVGSIDEIASVEETLLSFFNEIKIDEGKPTWTLPKDWTERDASGMRLATLVIPVSDSQSEIELSVIGLPLIGDWEKQVLDNSNRWLKQLGQSSLTIETMPQAVTKIEGSGTRLSVLTRTGFLCGRANDGTVCWSTCWT